VALRTNALELRLHSCAGMPRSSQLVNVAGRVLSLANLDKPMFPTGFTKGQVIDYYIRVSDHLLPHLSGRPITLKRYPNGVKAKHFYEKDAPSYTPKWVPRFPVPRRRGGREICYVLVNDLATLLWTVNLANLEMHPFLHRVPELQQPTAIVFDLDPGEGTGILECAEVALLLKKAFDKTGLRSFAKVSGSKGIQTYVPLNRPVTYAETQPYARRMAESIEHEHRGSVVTAMAKELRQGKVFIDWSQNSDFKTTVAPYSLRAKQDDPFISLPVVWKELTAAIRKGDSSALYFQPEEALARIKGKKDPFAAVLSLQQRLPAMVHQSGM